MSAFETRNPLRAGRQYGDNGASSRVAYGSYSETREREAAIRDAEWQTTGKNNVIEIALNTSRRNLAAAREVAEGGDHDG